MIIGVGAYMLAVVAMHTQPPLLISRRNAEILTGLPWRRVIDHALRNGIPVGRVGRARVVRADLMLAALELESEVAAASDPANAVRAALGLRRRA